MLLEELPVSDEKPEKFKRKTSNDTTLEELKKFTLKNDLVTKMKYHQSSGHITH